MNIVPSSVSVRLYRGAEGVAPVVSKLDGRQASVYNVTSVCCPAANVEHEARPLQNTGIKGKVSDDSWKGVHQPRTTSEYAAKTQLDDRPVVSV